MHDVIFITPSMTEGMVEEPVGTMQLATILDSHGISCEILPMYEIGSLYDFETFMANAMVIIGQKRPKIVSIYTRCDTYHIDLRLAEYIKREWPDTYIVFGGPQSDITSEETIRQIPYVDYVCCGEGENTIYPFFSSLLKGEPDHSVAGLVYRDGDKVIKNPRPALIEDLDTVPPIDYSFVRFSRTNKKIDQYFTIDVGRGCPFGCTYCSTNTFWGRKFRLKSPERIVEEMRSAHERFGVTDFKFTHDMFTLNRKSVIRTCELMGTLDFQVHWKCTARLDCIDPELVDIMAASGMERIFIGIETGSPRMQKLINKNLKLDNAVEMVAYLKKKNIETTASFMYGFPEETEEDLGYTLRLIRDLLALKSVFAPMHLCTFLAGTEMARQYRDEMTPTDQFSDVTGEFAIEECRDLIDGHPELFLHMLEYKTELRTKLRHLKTFVNTWRFMQPVYQYLSEKYGDDLVAMYYDFVEANAQMLDDVLYWRPYAGLERMAKEDRFPAKFADDENYDIIRDYYRMCVAEHFQHLKAGEVDTQVYCFHPEERNKKERIQDYERCVAVVTRSDGRVRTVAYPLPPKNN